ncbi:hypothetical protein [Paenibacillus sp. TC-CSREp1]|uniref:hypothetical protein n=1 Tax=Paenibacillus sp. TC-CSREp1 TaxID=3410089 RepID=UPI003CF750C5
MSRPREHYTVLCDGYPLGISGKSRMMRTYKSRKDAEAAAKSLGENRPTQKFEAARILFGVINEE